MCESREDAAALDTADTGWIDIMDGMEPRLLESDVKVRCQGFLPPKPPGDTSWSVQHSSPWQSEKLVLSTENPFKGMNIWPTSPLNGQAAREACPQCFKSRKFFCYTCYVPVESLQNHVPSIHLPVKIDIVKHAREVEGKSTAVHAPIIAPKDVNMYIFPDIPDYRQERALLVFPGKKSRTLQEIVLEASKAGAKSSNEKITNEDAEEPSKSEMNNINCDSKRVDEIFPYDKIVFIDSTWNQCKGMHRDERLADIPCVIISSRNTIFWRYQKGKPKEYLATIEAIYYFLVDFHLIVTQKEYRGEYDNMLFFFKFMYEKIHELYDHSTLRAYTRD